MTRGVEGGTTLSKQTNDLICSFSASQNLIKENKDTKALEFYILVA